MWEFKDTIKNARKKLEVRMEAAMPCKLRTKKRPNKLRETYIETKWCNNIQKTQHACIVDAHESTRKRLESTLPKGPEDHKAEKGFNSLSHKNLVHKCVPMPQLEKIAAKKEVVLEAQKEQRTVLFAKVMDICHLKKLRS